MLEIYLFGIILTFILFCFGKIKATDKNGEELTDYTVMFLMSLAFPYIWLKIAEEKFYGE